MLDFFRIEISLLFHWNKVVCIVNSTLKKWAENMKNETKNNYMYSYPDGKKTYTDENVITSVRSSLSRCPFCNEIYIRFAFDKEKIMFYPWISVSGDFIVEPVIFHCNYRRSNVRKNQRIRRIAAHGIPQTQIREDGQV